MPVMGKRMDRRWEEDRPVPVPLHDLDVGMRVSGKVCFKSTAGVFLDIGAVKNARLDVSWKIGGRYKAGEIISNCLVTAVDVRTKKLRVSPPREATEAFQKETEERLRAEHLAELAEVRRLHAEEITSLRTEMDQALQDLRQTLKQEADAFVVVMQQKVTAAEECAKEADSRALDLSRFYFATKKSIEERCQKQVDSLKEALMGVRLEAAEEEHLATQEHEKISMLLADAESKCQRLHCGLQRSALEALRHAAILDAVQDALALSKEEGRLLEEQLRRAEAQLNGLKGENKVLSHQIESLNLKMGEKNEALRLKEDCCAQLKEAFDGLSKKNRVLIEEKLNAEKALDHAKAALKGLNQKLEQEMKDKREEVYNFRVELDRHKAEATVASNSFEEVGKFLAELRKELATCCLDPISMEPVNDPVVAADLHTYDRKSNEAWYKVNPTSPLTRAPMEIDTLRNRAASLENLCKKYWPGKA